MKLLLLSLFSFSFLFTLNAQESSKQTLFTGGIILDKYLQVENHTLISPVSTQFPELNFGTDPSSRLYYGDAIRGQVSLGLRKVNLKGNIISLNLFAGRQKWDRTKTVTVENEDLNIIAAVPVYIGKVKQNTVGLNVTQSFCLVKKETQLRAYIGVRADGRYTFGKYRSLAGLEENFNIDRHRVDLQLAVVPELIYFFPGDMFAMSLAAHLLPIGFELNKKETFNPDFVEDEGISSFNAFDFMNHGKSRFELGFAWVL